MKHTPTFWFCWLFVFALSIVSCKRDDDRMVNIDIAFSSYTINNLPDGTRRIETVVVVTQLGNYFIPEYRFEISEWGDEAVIDSYSTTLPSAREFITQTVIVPGPGNYMVTVRLGTEQNYSSTGKLFIVP